MYVTDQPAIITSGMIKLSRSLISNIVENVALYIIVITPYAHMPYLHQLHGVFFICGKMVSPAPQHPLTQLPNAGRIL